MTYTLENLLVIFVYVVVSVGLLQLLRAGISQFLKWDVGEKEKQLQQKLLELQHEADRYKEDVADLRKQIKILLRQYDDAVIKMANLEIRYKQAMDDAESLREEIERMRKEVKSEERGNRVLIAAVGSKKPSLGLDLASLRAVEMETGLSVERITEATPEKLKISLDRAKMRSTITYLHLSVDSSHEGYLLNDEIVGPDWLSEILSGVTVLVVAGSESDRVADFLGVVPYVVSMSEKVPPRDAALFSRAFWTEIGKGIGPSLSLQRSLKRAPSGMSEYVVRHWSE